MLREFCSELQNDLELTLDVLQNAALGCRFTPFLKPGFASKTVRARENGMCHKRKSKRCLGNLFGSRNPNGNTVGKQDAENLKQVENEE